MHTCKDCGQKNLGAMFCKKCGQDLFARKRQYDLFNRERKSLLGRPVIFK